MFLSISFYAGLVAVVGYLVQRFDLLSKLFTVLLPLIYPIKDIENGTPIPSLPFDFPNGQGNVEKFLHGHQNSLKWGSKYGSLYRIWSGFHSEIVVSRPEHIEAIFRDSHTHIKAAANDSGYLMHQLLGSCLGLVSNSEWKTIRKATEPPFLRTATGQYVRLCEDAAAQHIESIFGNKPGASTTNAQIHPYGDLRIYPFIALADILYGGLTPELKEQLLEIIPNRDSVFRAMIQGGLTRFPISRFLPLKPLRELYQFKTEWAKWNDDTHAEALRKRDRGEPPAPIIDMYAKVSEVPGGMSREALLQTLDEMLFANLDVSIGGLAWSLAFIAALPHVQEKLLHEIRTQMVDDEQRSAYLLSQSNYLHYILLESSRLRPVVAFSVAQSCPNPRRLGNFVFPAGTKFIVDADALNMRDPLWAPDNMTFRPERWADVSARRAKDIRYCYWRFGFGPRVCLGKYIVDLMMKTLIVELVRGWDIKLENEKKEQWAWNQDNWSLDPSMRIACTKRTD